MSRTLEFGRSNSSSAQPSVKDFRLISKSTDDVLNLTHAMNEGKSTKESSLGILDQPNQAFPSKEMTKKSESFSHNNEKGNLSSGSSSHKLCNMATDSVRKKVTFGKRRMQLNMVKLPLVDPNSRRHVILPLPVSKCQRQCGKTGISVTVSPPPALDSQKPVLIKTESNLPVPPPSALENQRLPHSKAKSNLPILLPPVLKSRKRPSGETYSNLFTKKRAVSLVSPSVKTENLDENSCEDQDKLCYRVIPMADIITTCARTSNYHKIMKRKKQVTWSACLVDHAKSHRVKNVTSAQKQQPLGRNISTMKQAPGQMALEQSFTSQVLTGKESSSSVQLEEQTSVEKTRAKPQIHKPQLLAVPPMIRKSNEKKSNRIVKKYVSQHRAKRGVPSPVLFGLPVQVKHLDNENAPLVVSIDRSLLKDTSPGAACTLITERLGEYKSIGIQASTGMVVDKDVLRAYVQTLVDDSLAKTKKQLKLTSKKVKKLVREKERLERLLEKKLNYSIEESQTSLPSEWLTSDSTSKSQLQSASTNGSESALKSPSSLRESSSSPSEDDCFQTVHQAISKFDRTSLDCNSKMNQRGSNPKVRQTGKEDSTDPNTQKWHLLGKDLQFYFLLILKIYLQMIRLPLRRGLEKQTNSLRINLNRLLSHVPFPKELSKTLIIRGSNFTVVDNHPAIPLSEASFQLGWLTVKLRSHLKQCEQFRHILPLVIESCIYLTDHDSQKILEELVKELRTSATIPSSLTRRRGGFSLSDKDVGSSSPYECMLDQGANDIGSGFSSQTDKPSSDVSTSTHAPGSVSPSSSSTTSQSLRSIGRITSHSQAPSPTVSSILHTPVYNFSVMQKEVFQKALECVTNAINTIFSGNSHRRDSQCQAHVPVSTPMITSTPCAVSGSSPSLSVKSAAVVESYSQRKGITRLPVVTATVLTENIVKEQCLTFSDSKSNTVTEEKQISPHFVNNCAAGVGEEPPPPKSINKGPAVVGGKLASTNSTNKSQTVVKEKQTTPWSNEDPAIVGGKVAVPNSINKHSALVETSPISSTIKAPVAVGGKQMSSMPSQRTVRGKYTSPNSTDYPRVVETSPNSTIKDPAISVRNYITVVPATVIPASIISGLHSLDIPKAQTLASNIVACSPSMKEGSVATQHQTTMGSSSSAQSHPMTSTHAQGLNLTTSLLATQSLTKKLETLKQQMNEDPSACVVGNVQGYSHSLSQRIQNIKDKDIVSTPGPVRLIAPSPTVYSIEQWANDIR